MLRTLASISLITALLTACGGGGGGGGSSPAATPTATPPQTGSLTVLLGDGPSADYDGILLHIDRVLLLGGEPRQDVVLADAPAVVDLLQLRNITELLIDTEVEAGTYSKIRLEVSRIEAVTHDDAGNVLDSVDVDVPANGKVDLNPQGEFDVEAGGDLVVEVDIDLDRSVKLHETGNGRLKFRPVVFVRVLDATVQLRLIRLFGQIDNIDADGFDLCRIDRLSDAMDQPDDDCVPVEAADDVRIVDSDGRAIALEQLVNGDMATVFGRVRFGAESETVVAAVIASGERDAFTHIGGIVSTGHANGTFELSRQSRETDVLRTRSVELVDDALVLDGNGQPTTADAIVEGAEAEVFGVDRDDASFIGVLVWVDSADEPDSVTGLLTAINLSEDSLTLENEGVELCVTFDDDTAFLEVVENDETAEVTELSVADLASGLTTEAFGELVDGCLHADEIVFERTVD